MKKSIITCFYLSLLVIICGFSFTGCSDEKEVLELNSGFVQFKLYKSGDRSILTNRSGVELDYLNDAKKIEVTLNYNNTTIKQTLNLNAYNADNAEYGLTSDKMELLVGNYSIVGYRLFDAIDKEILTGFVSDNTFTVVQGGLEVKGFNVSVTPRGKVRFTLVKDLSAIETRSSENSFLFKRVTKADVKVKNTFTSEETTFSKLPFSYSTFVEGNGSTHISALAQSDTVVTLKSGNYELVSYTLYNSSGSVLSSNESPVKSPFNILDNNVVTEADVAITISDEAEHIKDYRALKAIWEALDGENWSYFGENYPNGLNWNFDKDIDMWGDQPGVELNGQGRVISLIIGNFGPTGAVPDELGQLTELNVLSIGTHNDKVGSFSGSSVLMNEQEIITSRSHYADLFLKRDIRASFSKELVDSYKEFSNIEFGNAMPLVESSSSNRPSTRDVMPGDITNRVTSLPETIGSLTKLTHLYLANGLVTTLPAAMSQLVSLTDVEIYNCPKMVKYPDALNTIPKMVALNIARNIQMPHSELYRGLNDFATSSPSRGELQLLYAGFNNLEELPASFKNLLKIGLLDLSHNKLHGELPSLTTDVKPVQLFLDNNQITSLPKDFCGIEDIESIYLSNNKFTKMPNIFSAKSAYVITTIDLSYNQIDGIEGELAEYDGVKVQTLSLAANKLTKFPSWLFNAGSTIGMLNVSGNSISSFEKESFYGDKLNMLESVDLSYNKLTELPSNFDATTLPYLYGLDVSSNSFTDFPYAPLNVSRLTVMIIRNQRDEAGKRTLRTWPTGLYTCPSLRGFYIGGNDLRKIDDTISYLIYRFEIADNPNITIDVSAVCPYIRSGSYQLIYDRTQDIRGCDALNLVN